METIQLKGIIKYNDDEGQRIDLIDGDTEFNLVKAFEDAVNEHGNMVQVNYWLTDKPCMKEQMLEGWLKKVFGAIETDCDEIFQGSWTYENSSCVGYDKYWKLQVGGHNLFDELSGKDGRFIIIELNFKIGEKNKLNII